MSTGEPAPAEDKRTPVARQQLTDVTRQRLLDTLVVEGVWWWGALDEVALLQRLYNLDALETTTTGTTRPGRTSPSTA